MAKNKKAVSIFRVVFFLVLLFSILGIYIFVKPSYQTNVAFSGIEELIVPLQGIVVLDEELFTSERKGFALMNYSDGTRVLAKTHVASLYSDDIDETKVSRLKELNEKINSLENSIKNQSKEEAANENSTALLQKKMNRISYYGAKGDFSNIQKETIDFTNMIFGADMEVQAEKLESLKAEKKIIENLIDANDIEFFSNTAGVLYSKTDGYETIFSKDAMKTITPDGLKTLVGSQPVNYQKSNSRFIFGKIVNNYEISIFSVCNKEDIEGLTIEEELTIKSSDVTNGSVPCMLASISEETNGEVIIELRVSRNIDSFIKERKIQFDLVKKSYSGLKIPTEAIMKEKSEKGDEINYVLAIKDGSIVKKTVEIKYQTDKFTIIKEDNANPNNVILYDLVLTKARNISAGSVAIPGR